MKRLGLRTRLTLWHAVTTTVILVAVGLAADWLLTRTVIGQLDAALLVIAETEAGSALDSPIGIHLHELDTLPNSASLRPHKLDKLVQIIDDRGKVLLRSATLGHTDLPAPPYLVQRTQRGETVIETAPWHDGEPVRLLTIPIAVGGAYPYAVQVGTPLQPTYAFLATARALWVVTSLAVLAVVLATGTLLTRSALRPVSRALEMAGQIGMGIGGRRLPHPGTDDEIGRLVATLNAMLDRLEKNVDAHRRFTADAAHELRTPLSHLRSEIEIALRRPRSAEWYQDVLRSGLEETDRLTALTEALLTLARLDADEVDGTEPGAIAEISDVLETVRGRLAAEAAQRTVEIVVSPSPNLAVDVPPGLLGLLLGNLLQNAVKFSAGGGRVVAAVAVDHGEAVVSVADNGPGIPDAQRSKIFERFFRVDEARSDAVPGFGLGLSIARAIAGRYGGTLDVASNPGGGSVFVARLPLAHATAAATLAGSAAPLVEPSEPTPQKPA
ncbi:MAG: ATP-binding protein [Acidobacteriota bacterium]